MEVSMVMLHLENSVVNWATFRIDLFFNITCKRNQKYQITIRNTPSTKDVKKNITNKLKCVKNLFLLTPSYIHVRDNVYKQKIDQYLRIFL